MSRHQGNKRTDPEGWEDIWTQRIIVGIALIFLVWMISIGLRQPDVSDLVPPATTEATP